MNLSTTAVKKTAKTTLKNNFFKSIVACSIYTFIWIICLISYRLLDQVIGTLGAYICVIALIVFLISPLSLGLVYFFVRLIFESETEPVLVFKYFSGAKDYKRCMSLILPIAGNALYTGVLLFLPAFLTDLIASGKIFKLIGAKMPLWISGLWGVSASLKALAVMFLIWIMLKYYLAPFLFVADEDMDPLEAMHMSKIISRVSKKDFIWLVISFLWYILACFFMIPNIFILPYLGASYCVHCRFAVAAYNKNVEEINQRNIPSFEVI